MNCCLSKMKRGEKRTVRDPKRIYRLLSLLSELWNLVPDWRLGQLIANLSRNVGWDDPYYVEDEDMEKEILNFIERFGK